MLFYYCEEVKGTGKVRVKYGKTRSSMKCIVDNYIGLRTLVLLKNAPVGVAITLFSDNVGNRLQSILLDFFLVALYNEGGIRVPNF